MFLIPGFCALRVAGLSLSRLLSCPQHFECSVVLMLSFNNSNPMGVVLNHPLIWNQVRGVHDGARQALKGAPLTLGGPVIDPTNAFVVLTRRQGLAGFMEVRNGLYWGQGEAFHVAFTHISTNQASPDEFWFFLGFSGWQEAQLEDEIKHGWWYIAHCDAETVTWKAHELQNPGDEQLKIVKRDFWLNVMELMGGNNKVIAESLRRSVQHQVI